MHIGDMDRGASHCENTSQELPPDRVPCQAGCVGKRVSPLWLLSEHSSQMRKNTTPTIFKTPLKSFLWPALSVSLCVRHH